MRSASFSLPLMFVGQDALAGEELVAVRAFLLLQPVRRFGQVFAVAAVGGVGFFAMGIRG